MTKSPVAQNRHRSRELAVQFLYSLDTRPGQALDASADIFVSECGFASGESAEVRAYMLFLVRGTWKQCPEIDNMMRRVVTGWRPERMVAVDRAVLRLAVFEGFLEKKVPFAVAISEAVELARAFGTEESGKFVNGVLARVMRSVAGRDEADERTNNAVADTEVSADRR
ncbi:MAG: transcription antitermination factor NusB [Synergistaceae bacterium]|nr:transcription antitermination factor NusB [Synergistaceae bacterium]